MISNDEYSKLLDQQFETKTNISANKIIPGTILKISEQHVVVDIGYKSEGQIPKEEFINTGSADDLKTGQTIEVFIEKLEDREGNIRLSHEKAIKNKDKYSGCTVHFVNSRLDSGKIINQKKVKINKLDTPKILAKKILTQEHKLYPAAIIKAFSL